MKDSNLLTQNQLREEVDYDHLTGFFHRKDGSRGGSQSGNPGYRRISIKNKMYREHRLAFLWMNGVIPKFVDHKDGDILNNKWDNLRECTQKENNRNAGISKNNTSGVKGVSWSKNMNKWRARITVDYVETILGYFDSLEDAKKVVEQARLDNHKEFARNV